MLAIINDIKVLINNEKKIIEIRCKSLEEIDKMNKNIENLKQKFNNYSFFINLDNKFRLNDLNINELDKFKNHVNQNLKILIQIKELEEKKTKTEKYIYNIVASLPGKKKYIQATMFSIMPLDTLKINSYYIADGKLEVGDSRYIKKNQKNLGKEINYKFIIKAIEEYEFKEEEIIKHYEIPRTELHLHTSFSKNDAFITPNDLKKCFKENKLKTVALTDHGAVFAFVPFVNQLKKEFKDTDKKLILGTEAYSIDYDEYQTQLYKKQNELFNKISQLEETDNSFEIDNITEQIKSLREQRDKNKRIMKRKTASDEEKENAESQMNEIIVEISELEAEIKNIKEADKNNQIEKLSAEKEFEYLETQFGCINDIDRDHLTILLKTKDEEINYRGEIIKINPGLVELYKLITLSYQKYFSAPTLEKYKKQGKRPMIPYHEIFKPEVRKHFIITSACAFGKHMKLAVNNKWDEFRKWIHNLDAVEIQPSWNNKYMINHDDYPNINSIEDVYKLHRKIYDICKEEGIPCIITSDAHVNEKEDRIFRSTFKSGYINLIKQWAKEEKINSSTDDDFSIDTQPFIMSYEDVLEDYTKQGFTSTEIEEMNKNSDILGDQCANAFDITILPNKLFLPDFPNLNAKEEIPKIVWEEAIKKWSKDGTKDSIHPVILERIEKELKAVELTGFEVLYAIARYCCLKSIELGYPVGSRGSAGSMILTYLMGIGENNPLPPHYYCKHCHHVEFVKTELIGLDLEDKVCPECGETMDGDGLNIESENFLG